MFELFLRVNFNRIQQGYSKLKTSVEFHSLENRSQSKLSYSKYFKCIMCFVKLCDREVPKLEASISVCTTEIMAEKEICCG